MTDRTLTSQHNKKEQSELQKLVIATTVAESAFTEAGHEVVETRTAHRHTNKHAADNIRGKDKHE